jgi:hypothetical protein
MMDDGGKNVTKMASTGFRVINQDSRNTLDQSLTIFFRSERHFMYLEFCIWLTLIDLIQLIAINRSLHMMFAQSKYYFSCYKSIETYVLIESKSVQKITFSAFSV